MKYSGLGGEICAQSAIGTTITQMGNQKHLEREKGVAGGMELETDHRPGRISVLLAADYMSYGSILKIVSF